MYKLCVETETTDAKRKRSLEKATLRPNIVEMDTLTELDIKTTV